MTADGPLQLGIYLGVLLACVKPLGLYMAKVIDLLLSAVGLAWVQRS